MDKGLLRYIGWIVLLGAFVTLSVEAKGRYKVVRLPGPDIAEARAVSGACMVQSDSVVYVAGGLYPHATDAQEYVSGDQNLISRDQHSLAGTWLHNSTSQLSAQVLKWNGHHWKLAGKLRRPLAYGVAFAVPGGFIYAGGATAKGSGQQVDLYQFYDSGLPVVEALPDLPVALERMAGVKIENRLFLAGGLADGKPVNSLYMFDLDNPDTGWQLISEFPGPPRVEPVMAVARQEGRQHLFMWGGYAPGYAGNDPVVSVDGLRYDLTSSQWTSVVPPTDPKGNVISLGAATAVSWNEARIVVAGGFDARVKLKELRRTHMFRGVERWSLLQHYGSRPAEWYRFNSRLLLFDAERNRWKVLAEADELARTGAAAVKFGSELILFQGEIKPGVTNNEVLKMKLPE